MRDYKSGFSVDTLADDPSYMALAASFGTLAKEQAEKSDALALAYEKEQARVEILQEEEELEKRQKEAQAINWIVTGLCAAGSIAAIVATGGAKQWYINNLEDIMTCQ